VVPKRFSRLKKSRVLRVLKVIRGRISQVFREPKEIRVIKVLASKVLRAIKVTPSPEPKARREIKETLAHKGHSAKGHKVRKEFKGFPEERKVSKGQSVHKEIRASSEVREVKAVRASKALVFKEIREIKDLLEAPAAKVGLARRGARGTLAHKAIRASDFRVLKEPRATKGLASKGRKAAKASLARRSTLRFSA
jgi:hypothetical protein